jgi:methionine-S-sulfoxide reductase
MTQPTEKEATFAGGCFWCMVSPFANIDGVLSVVSGFAGGHVQNPTYEQVCAGNTGHVEAVQITYDANQVDYKTLLNTFWQQIDPTDAGGSFYDRGQHYTSAIFYHDEQQQSLAEQSKQDLEASQRFTQPIATVIKPYTNFYPAEEYHQHYHQKNPEHYQRYRIGSGRDAFILKVWNK